MWHHKQDGSPMSRESLVKFLCLTTILIGCVSQMYAHDNALDDFLLCRQCGHEVAQADQLRPIPSKLAHRQRNETVLGVENVLIQLFINPAGKKFEVITASKSDVFKGDKAYSEFSWFPGFLWRMCVCPRCGFHLGWSFEPVDHTEGKKNTEKTFVALILENLLHEDYANNLLITPKAYYS